MEGKETCTECGCQCSRCDSHGLHLHREIESLKQRVIERDFHILRLETTVLREAERFPHGEVGELRSQMGQWQDKYDRLLESHKKLQRVNQNLEDKLLRIVDKYETDKTALGQDVATLTKHLVAARTELNRLRDLSERYRNDLHLAIQLLQCKPSTFISRRLETLPVDLQQKVKSCLNTHQREARKPDYKVIKVPISTFPPTAMVYAVDKAKEAEDTVQDVAEDERVSAAILARVLQEREQERSAGCSCGRGPLAPRRVDVSVQTRPPHIGDRDALSQPFLFEPGRRGGGGVVGGTRRSVENSGGGISRGGSLDTMRPVSMTTAAATSPLSEPVPVRQSVSAGHRGRCSAAEPIPAPPPPVTSSPAASAAWWTSATEPGGADSNWENSWDFSPPHSAAGNGVSSSRNRPDSVSSGDSSAAGSGGAASKAASLRMETRI